MGSSHDFKAFRLLQAPDGPMEEPSGRTDLMAFYKLSRLYQRISSDQPGNFYTQLADTSFSSHRWHKTAKGSLASLAGLAQHAAPAEALKLDEGLLEAFGLQPGKYALPESELGPLVDMSALGDLDTLKPEKKKQKREKEKDKDEHKAKKERREKTLKINFGGKPQQ